MDDARFEILHATLAMLAPHMARGALWHVPQLPLAQVAAALARDDSSQVATWLDQGELCRVGERVWTRWLRRAEEDLQVVIVRPFVLVRPR